MTKNEEEVLSLISINPFISQEDIAKEIGLSRSGVAAIIRKLTSEGHIEGRGYFLSKPGYVAVIGGVNVDYVGRSHKKITDKNSNPGKIHSTIGGAGHNMAANLTKLHVDNYFITVYGNDADGNQIIVDSKEHDLDMSYSQKLENVNSSTYMYIEDFEGRRLLGIDDMDIYEYITSEFLDIRKEVINNSDYCLVDTNLPKESFKWLYENLTIPLVVKTTTNLKNSTILSSKMRINTLVTTEEEFISLLNDSTNQTLTIKEGMKFLGSKGIETIILYNYLNGILCYVHSEGQFIRQKPVTISHIETVNGSHAAFTSTYVWAKMKKWPLKDCLLLSYTSSILNIASKENVNDDLSPIELYKLKRLLFEK
ncbi:PfkB family carbohydrate kinase [Aerococcaceae bacterium 50-4]